MYAILEEEYLSRHLKTENKPPIVCPGLSFTSNAKYLRKKTFIYNHSLNASNFYLVSKDLPISGINFN